jgi:hypothetical protein
MTAPTAAAATMDRARQSSVRRLARKHVTPERLNGQNAAQTSGKHNSQHPTRQRRRFCQSAVISVTSLSAVDALLPVMFVFSIVKLLSGRRARPPPVPVPDTPLTPD